MPTLANVILEGLHSARPTAEIPGRTYFETDTGLTFRDNGSSWDIMSVGIQTDGWISSASMVYSSSDAPSYVVTMTGDQSGVYQAGQRIKLTLDNSVRYFIVTKVEISGSTALTLYGGIDYALSGSPISNSYYSLMKAPFGFPLSPTKWTVETTDDQFRTQGTPSQNTWYNINSNLINIPIGCWKTYYKVTPQSSDSTDTSWYIQSTLSTGNNNESDSDLTCAFGLGNIAFNYTTLTTEKFLSLTSKTAYYLNIRTTSTNLDNIYLRGDLSKTIIRAVCGYL
jgi:hypothetical protein